MEHLARFRPHPRGFGFLHLTDADTFTAREVTITRDDGPAVTGDRAFVAPPMARGLVADDLVAADLSADDRGLSTTSVAVRQRPRRMLVGTVVDGPGRLVLDPDRALATGWIDLDPSVVTAVRGATGRIIVVLRSESADGAPLGKALVAGPFVAGSPQAVRATTTVVAYERAAVDLIPSGPGAAGLDDLDAAMTHARFVGIVAGGGRGAAAGLDATAKAAESGVVPFGATGIPGQDLEPTDRTGETCFTVDSASARDLDDAICAVWSKDPDATVSVAVHIADVASSVAIGSPADRYARTVAATAYPVIGANAPMLDPVLSEEALSLLPGGPRQVLSARFEVAPDGAIGDVVIELATIVSDARLSYHAVERLLAGDDEALRDELDAPDRGPATADAVSDAVEAAIEAARRLGVERDGRATFDRLFTSADWEPALVDGKLTVVAAEPDAEAYRLIERLMVAANEAVAAFLARHEIPALYRVHAGLDPQRVDRVAAAAAAIDVELPGLADDGGGHHLMSDILVAIDQLTAQERRADRDLLMAVAADAMARATYDPDPSPHRGLAATAYTHFTSPIRRYTDLVVHRQLRAALAGEPPPWSVAELSGVAAWLDHRAGALSLMQAMERRELWALLLDRGHVDGTLETVITGLTTNGARVRIPALGLNGFITAERLLGLPSGQRGALVVDEHGLSTTSGPWSVGTVLGVRFIGLDDTGRPIWRPAEPAA